MGTPRKPPIDLNIAQAFRDFIDEYYEGKQVRFYKKHHYTKRQCEGWYHGRIHIPEQVIALMRAETAAARGEVVLPSVAIEPTLAEHGVFVNARLLRQGFLTINIREIGPRLLKIKSLSVAAMGKLIEEEEELTGVIRDLGLELPAAGPLRETIDKLCQQMTEYGKTIRFAEQRLVRRERIEVKESAKK